MTLASKSSTSSTEKVTPKPVLPIFSYSVAHPSVRDRDEFPPGFEGHLHTNRNFPHSLSVPDEKQGKVDVMDEGVGNREPLPKVGCEHLNNLRVLREEGNNVNGEWGFEGQEGKSSKSIFTFHEVDNLQDKVEVMFAEEGNLSLASSKVFDISE